ncbi:hypothetical protein EBU71_00650 [bacterium]|nr:hypothetical protein [Candidatus Elulimicrobium humile]
MAQIRASNIANNTLEAISFDLPTSNLINISALAFSTANTANNLAQAANTTADAQLSQIGSSLPLISNIIVTDASFNNVSHTSTAANTTGDFISVRGTGFASGANVIFGSFSNGFITATTTTFVDSQRLNVTIPARASGLYPVYVVNSNGGTGIRLPGLRVTTFPSWTTGTTLANATVSTAYSNTLVATADSTITYSNTTALPAGLSLAANGLISGTPTTAATSTFTVLATDVESQANARTFSLTTVSGILQGSLWTWGNNDFGGMGVDSIGVTRRSSPTQVGTATNWTQFGAYQTFSAGVKADGTLWTWGWGSQGGTGLNSPATRRSSPTQVGALTNWSKIGTGTAFALMMAVKNDGTLWGWGLNGAGQLGMNNVVSRSSPMQVGTSTNWSLVSQSRYNTAAIKTDGTLWLWGNGNYGQLGGNNATYRSSPTQVGTNTNWSTVVSGDRFCCALKTDGTLWVWGINQQGNTGLNDSTTNRSSPTQIGTATNWSKLFVTGGVLAMATKTDGTLWAWGYNGGGNLGLNDRANRSSPTQVGALTNWNIPATAGSGENNALCTTTSNALWSWGAGISTNFGQLGLSDLIARSSPVQVGSATNWATVGAGTVSMAIRT